MPRRKGTYLPKYFSIKISIAMIVIPCHKHQSVYGNEVPCRKGTYLPTHIPILSIKISIAMIVIPCHKHQSFNGNEVPCRKGTYLPMLSIKVKHQLSDV